MVKYSQALSRLPYNITSGYESSGRAGPPLFPAVWHQIFRHVVEPAMGRRASDAPVTGLAAPAVAEGFQQRCAALARLDSLPPIAPAAVQKLLKTHREQLCALLMHGPAATDTLEGGPAGGGGPKGTSAETEPASSLDWQRAAAARRSRASASLYAAGASSSAGPSPSGRGMAVNAQCPDAGPTCGTQRVAGHGGGVGDRPGSLEVRAAQ